MLLLLQLHCTERHTVFLRSDAAATIYFTACFVLLLFEGGVYYPFGKPGDINDGYKVGTSETVTVARRCQ